MRLPGFLAATPRYAFTRLGGIAWTGLATTVYVTLGVVVTNAEGLAPLAMVVVALFIALTALSYTELTAMRDGQGRRVADPPGASGFARAAFDERVSFIAGWAVVLDLLLLTAIGAEGAASYLVVLLPSLSGNEPAVALVASLVLIVAVGVRNGRAPNLARGVGIRVLLALDAVVLGVLGVALLVSTIDRGLPLFPASPGVDASDALLAGTLGLLALTGFETAATLSGEATIPRQRRRRFLVGLALGATATLGFAAVLGAANQALLTASHRIDSPVSALALAVEPKWLADGLRAIAALLAVSTLVVATNGAILAVARLGSTLATTRQIPARIGRLSQRHGTPTLVIASAVLLAAVLVATLDLEELVGLYAFGALLSVGIVHAAVLRLRVTMPGADRRFRIPVTLPGTGLPLPATAGLLLAGIGWVAVIALHERAALVGVGWMVGGLLLYVATRRHGHLPLARSVSVPADVLTRERGGGEFGSVLVPIFGRPLDDDIVQTAGRLARERAIAVDERGDAQIEAIWVFEIPMSLPMEGALDEDRLKAARAALARAKAIGEEYEGVTVATATVRARRVGQGIVDEAKRRGVEAIVMAAEEPSRVRGGSTLGGTGDIAGRAMGPVTTYVLQHAPCRVLMTAPPLGDRPASSGEPPAGDAAAAGS